SRGQPEAQQHHIGALVPGHADRRYAVRCLDDLISGVLQSPRQAMPEVVVVLDDENLRSARAAVAHTAASGVVPVAMMGTVKQMAAPCSGTLSAHMRPP